VAVKLHVPVPLIIFTVLPEIEQAPLAVMDAVVLALVVAETTNVELSARHAPPDNDSYAKWSSGYFIETTYSDYLFNRRTRD
jgi:hypothetical protein